MNDEPDDDDLVEDGVDAPEGIVLRASALRWVWVLIGSLVFVSLGGAMALAPRTGVVANVTGAFVVIVFAFCAIVAIRQILNPGLLLIRREAIEIHRRGRVTTFEFHDCGRFDAWRNPARGTMSVVFDYALDDDTELNRTNRRLMGGSRSITDNYGMMTEDLAKLLNDVRAAANRGGASSGTG